MTAAPGNEREFVAQFNPFNIWRIAFTVVATPMAIKPIYWPPHWWRLCDCGISLTEQARASHGVR